MKTYKVGIWEEQSGYVYINAKNQKDANERVKEMVEEVGIEDLKEYFCEDIENVDIIHRNVIFI